MAHDAQPTRAPRLRTTLVPARRPCRRAVALAAALALLALAPATGAPAAAEGVLVLYGRGFGHGIGLSQWGALERARAGQDFRTILGFYYPGTRIGPAPARAIRVLVASGSTFALGADAPFTAVGPSGERRTLEAGRYDAAGLAAAGALPLLLEPGTAPLVVAGRPYRGTITLAEGPDGLLAVDTLPLERYVADVVSIECPGSWPQAALRAQAVASRTYALVHLRPRQAFDLYPDDRSQNYRGLARELPGAARAAAATRGLVLRFAGRLADAVFSAANGGRTNVAQGYLGTRAVPYLVARPDRFDAQAPAAAWGPTRVTLAQVRAAFPQVPADTVSVSVSRNAAGRATALEFTGADGTTARVDGYAFGERLDLRSTWLSVELTA